MNIPIEIPKKAIITGRIIERIYTFDRDCAPPLIKKDS
jgi:hypothetical protein